MSKSEGKAILLALAVGAGSLPLGFMMGYFLIFAAFKTPAGPRDGQDGLAEFMRLLYSAVVAGVSAVIVAAITIWRRWPRGQEQHR